MSTIITNIDANNLNLRTVVDILGESYFIPAYQRGYRWTDVQVLQLLDDIDSFKVVSSEDGSEPFYCLQPIVVKRNGDSFEVIDGQQRLTTITIFIHYFNSVFAGRRKQKKPTITYETRLTSADFIDSMEINGPDELDPSWDSLKKALPNIAIKCEPFSENDNIDFFHIAQAFKAIHYWFLKKGETFDYESIRSKLLNHSKVIWYEVEDTASNNSVDIFTRLNIGKIPLTNGELIKALFLATGNFNTNEASLRQIQIASEWDSIEKSLQDDDFWFFIYNPKNPLSYDNRIEYLFDLMKGKTSDCEFYFTFNEFHNDFQNILLDGKPDIDRIWLSVKRLFLTFEEWYKDYKLYHYVGYLISCSDPSRITDCINNLLTLSKNNKDVFKQKLKVEIKKTIPDNLDELEYGDKTIRKVLLLFNIATVLQTQKSDMRFPFNKYKNEDWDIEHVNSQTDKTIEDEPQRRAWIDDILDYFVGSVEEDAVNSYVSEENLSANPARRQLCQEILQLRQSRKIDDGDFKAAYDKVQRIFREDQPLPNKDSLANLALLDSKTNRSYGNAFFPIKRKRIIENDSMGIFVPIATKNLFLKYYSSVSDQMMAWKEKDANDYLDAIKRVLGAFFNTNEEEL